MKLFRKSKPVTALIVYKSYISCFLFRSNFTEAIDKQEFVLDSKDLQRKKRILDCLESIYDTAFKYPVGPHLLKEYYKSITDFLDHIYYGEYNQDKIGHQPKHDFYARFLMPSEQRFYDWLDSLINQDVFVTAMQAEKFEVLGKTDDELLKSFLSYDLHILSESPVQYPERLLKVLVSEGKFVFGVDSLLDKVEISILPFVISQAEKFLSKLMDKKSEGKIYYEELVSFGNQHGTQLVDMVPPLITFPASARLTKSFILQVHDFFKNRIQKVIIKGSNSAASCSGNGELSYYILDVGHHNWEVEWFEKIKLYQKKYVAGGKNAKSAIMIQAWVAEHDELHPRDNSFQQHLRIAAHKHNVVGESVWDVGIKYVNYVRSSGWKKFKSTDMSVISGARTFKSDMGHKKNELAILGQFLNLVSPMGGHALDFVFGRLKDEAEHKIYLLEANPSHVRGDFNGTHYYAGSKVIEGYVKWALDHFKGNKRATGRYTKKLFNELSSDARKDFLRGVFSLWHLTHDLLLDKILFCDESGLSWFNLEKAQKLESLAEESDQVLIDSDAA
ncbi:hypothetical protein HN587_00190 [Candidatus Woesearchaeota archaeon]|nr:hypothetical protein [Candidatus Woesearchaeota archaeon]